MKKHELEIRCEEARGQYLAAVAEHDRLLEESRQENSQAFKLRERLWAFQGEEKQAQEREIEAIEDRAHRLRLDAQAQARASESLNREIFRIEQAIAEAIDYGGTTPAQLSERRVAIETAEAECASIRGKIAEISGAETGTASADLERLREERKPLAARVALGEAPPEELDGLDGRITDTERAAREQAARQARRADAVAGLQDRLADAETRLAAARKAHEAASLDFLRGEAESAASRYRKKAEALIEAYRRVAALDALLRARAQTPLLSEPLNFRLPWIRSRAYPEGPCLANSPWCYVAALDEEAFNTLGKTILEELAAQGAAL